MDITMKQPCECPGANGWDRTTTRLIINQVLRLLSYISIYKSSSIGILYSKAHSFSMRQPRAFS